MGQGCRAVVCVPFNDFRKSASSVRATFAPSYKPEFLQSIASFSRATGGELMGLSLDRRRCVSCPRAFLHCEILVFQLREIECNPMK